MVLRFPVSLLHPRHSPDRGKDAEFPRHPSLRTGLADLSLQSGALRSAITSSMETEGFGFGFFEFR